MIELIEIEIADIIIGVRPRKSYGDIATLARSISEVGLLQPIAVTPDLQLICGQRRLMALQSLGHTTVQACVVVVDSIYEASLSENLHRLASAPDERAVPKKKYKQHMTKLVDSRQMSLFSCDTSVAKEDVTASIFA